MVKEMQKRKLIYVFLYIAAIIIFIISVYYRMNKRIDLIKNTEGLDVDFCLIDLMELVFGITKNFIIYIMAISLVIQLNNSFRSTIIIQYKSRIAYWGSMIKKCILIALGNTFLLSTITFIHALMLSDSVRTNWMDKDSYMVAINGEPNVFYVISSVEGIVLFVINIFVIALFVGIVVILLWFIINPILGVLFVLILDGLQAVCIHLFIKPFFAYTNINLSQIYFYGMDYASPLGALVWLTGLILCSILVIRKKNLLY